MDAAWARSDAWHVGVSAPPATGTFGVAAGMAGGGADVGGLRTATTGAGVAGRGAGVDGLRTATTGARVARAVAWGAAGSDGTADGTADGS